MRLNSKNGILSEAGRGELDYIIPTCPCGEFEDCCQCHPQENGDAAETGADFHSEPRQNGLSVDGYAGKKPQEQGDNQKGLPAVDKVEQISKRPRDKPQRQRHLDRGLVNKEKQRTEEQWGEGLETGKLEETVGEAEVSKADALTDLDSTATCDVAGNINVTSVALPEPSPEQPQVETSQSSPTQSQCVLQVPAAPSKPLPVPQPRKLKKPALVRQDGVEGSVQDQVEEQKRGQEVEGQQSPAVSVGRESTELKPDASGPGEAGVPVPPPRQTSLSPRLHRTLHPSLNKNTSHSLDVLSQPDLEGTAFEKREVEEDEEDTYGDFERYPITHSLPKQIQLGCHPPLADSRRASSEDSPRTPPRKPQRHSLPAPPPPPIGPPAPPHASTPMRELPAPPQEKTAWRFTRPCVTFFSRQMPTRSSVPPKGRAPSLGGKQRAQSFSAADLATRAHSQRRSLSFRKLLELRLSMKMLPKLLAKGGQSLDCTSLETNGGGRSLQRPTSCIEDTGICEEGVEGLVEYENVPLYEEIPEYMNLPFHGARLGWPHDPDGGESDIYEVQDPLHSCQDER